MYLSDFIRAFLVAVPCMAALPCYAQEPAAKPLHVVVSGVAGGIDNVLRAMVPKLAEALGQPVVVENRAGANGMIAAQAVARAEPDGNTLLYTTVSTMVYAPLVAKGSAPDPVASLVPVSTVYESFQVVVVSPRLPVQSLDELIRLAKANPGKVSYVSSGNGSLFHLLGELFKQQAGVDMLHVPQKSLTPAVQDLVGEHVDVGFLSYNAVRPHILSGKLRVLAVMESQRVPSIHNVPSVTERLPNFPKLPSWIALFAPAGTSDTRIKRVHQAVVEALATPPVKQLLESSMDVAGGKGGPELAADIKRDSALTARIIQTAKITAD